MIDYHKKGSYSLRHTEMVVIDECDRLFDMGFAEDLRWLLRRMPHPKDRQSMMFTATLSQRVMTLGWRQMNNPAEVIISAQQLTPDTIHQVLYHVATREKLSLLLGVLEREASSRTMIFVNTRYRAKHLVDDLRRHGFVARGLTGNVIQTKRLKVLDDFRDGTLPILVATDVASRGLHIEGVTHVVNYDLPQDAEDYVHRIGRTARVGAEGKAIYPGVRRLHLLVWTPFTSMSATSSPPSLPTTSLFAEVLPRPRSPRRTDAGRDRRPPARREHHDSSGGDSAGEDAAHAGGAAARALQAGPGRADKGLDRSLREEERPDSERPSNWRVGGSLSVHAGSSGPANEGSHHTMSRGRPASTTAVCTCIF